MFFIKLQVRFTCKRLVITAKNCYISNIFVQWMTSLLKASLKTFAFFSSRSIEIQIFVLIQITPPNTLDFQILITIYSWHLSDKYLYMLVILWGGDYIIHIALWNKEETFTIQIKTDNAITNCLIILVL